MVLADDIKEKFGWVIEEAEEVAHQGALIKNQFNLYFNLIQTCNYV
ncbi:MAG: hypothetical protein WCG10_03670 [Chlamydiota bacterium]